MLRLPDSPDEWVPSIHTSGRHFLTNKRTSETRWLWQKWDVDGRLFVRNISDPDVRLWVDEMDLAGRIAAGAATPEEIDQYKHYQRPAPPPPPTPPPPPPPPPPPHHAQYYQPSAMFGPRQHPAQTYAQERPHHIAPQQPPYHPEYSAQQEPYSVPHAHMQPPNSMFPNGIASFRAPQRSKDILLQPPPDESRPQPTIPHNRGHNRHSPDSQVPNRIRASREENDPGIHSGGRYWSAAAGRPKKKVKRHFANDARVRDRAAADKPRESKKTRSLFRQPPLPVAPGDFVPKIGGEDMVLSKLAKQFHDAAVDENDHDHRISALFQRDFLRSTGNGAGSPCSVRAQEGDNGFAFEPVVGTCEEIEKEYLRLTTAPRAEMIRPPRVLRQSLSRIKMLWEAEARDYDWVCKQLKSVRQDYKVQHVENSDVVDVYETHARIALTRSDLGEFNTCVAQVQELYKQVGQVEDVQDEFMSYRILYNLLVGARQWEQGKILAQFSKAERARPATSYALLIRHAIISGNYHHYFRLCFNPPPKTLISYLLVHFHDDMRYRALSTLVAAYGPGQPGYVPMSFVFDQLGWRVKNDDVEGADHEKIQEGFQKKVENDDVEGADHEKIREEFQKKVEEAGLGSLFDPLGMLEQPPWSLRALTFLMSLGAILVVDNSDNEPLSRIHLNCKATKTKGIKAPNASKKLITHAGS